MTTEIARTQQTSQDKVFKPFSTTNHGLFGIQRAMYLFGIQQGMYVDQGQFKFLDPDSLNDIDKVRCDNLNWVGDGFTYKDGQKKVFGDGWIRLSNVSYWSYVLDVAPEFFVTYMELSSPLGFEESLNIETFSPPLDQQTWWSKSLAELLRSAYEWSYVVDDPWNNTEAIAACSRKLFDILDFPEALIQEIESYPDMHVFKYLKGDINARLRPVSFPNVSDEMREFFTEKMQQYPPLLPHERI